ncbi:uncharacterized protein PADG_12453 [Paracoccidioides brasiliensis Pb18]|uniref:Uncharacterized protein n=1 Tax=Paracoccidioides brasiliensis (strain Pb18) TaxID=502780 RepID=A0A0A0HQG6_PARBD|nr:uncharacterized protein PADG_12453 [Paracoccidioides brasiliensis Pb18]KGM91469.1 hypothetical protein PADG_12453 [Paracoccidioides brasiliensis Pb18]
MEQNDTVAKNLSSTFNIVTAAINAGAAAAEAARDGARVDRTDAASAFLSVLAAASASASGFALVNAPTPAPAPAPAPAPVPASTSAFAPASAPAPATNPALTPCTCTFCVCPLLATGRTIASSSASAGFVSAVCDVVPAYEINRKATTVVEVWREWALSGNNVALPQHQTIYVASQQLAPLAFSSQSQAILAIPGRDVLIVRGSTTEAQVRSQRAIVHQQHPHPVPRNGGQFGGHVGIAIGAVITELDAPYEMEMMRRRMTPAWTRMRLTVAVLLHPILRHASVPRCRRPSPGRPALRSCMIPHTGT